MEHWEIEEVVEAAINGDQVAWSEIVRRHKRLVWFFISETGLPKADAEDVFQTVWLRLASHLADIREPRALPAWFRQTAMREAWSVRRKQQREGPTGSLLVSAMVDESPLPEDEIVATEDQRRLVVALRLVSEFCGQLLLMLFDEGSRYDDVAKRTGLKRGTISKRRRQCLAELRSILEEV